MPPELVEQDVTRLLNILSMRRGHNSMGEAEFIDKYILPMKPTTYHNELGEEMAFRVDIGTGPTILWSSHVDTVHRNSPEIVKQEVLVDPEMLVVYKNDNECLGADDGAGVWLLLNMIEAGVPGVYMFHRGEECGGIGSKYVTTHFAADFDGLKAAIAFDRRKDCSIITHQGGWRCCSDDFANGLADVLNLGTLKLDDTGSYTDTKEYIDIIGECTNVSVGYDGEHTKGEMLDLDYLLKLKAALLKGFAQGADLPAVRQPAEDDPEYYDAWTNYSSSGYGYFTAGEAKIRNLTYQDIVDMEWTQIKTLVLGASSGAIADLIYDLAHSAQDLDDTLTYGASLHGEDDANEGEMVFCNNCGIDVEADHDGNCPYCGNDLSDELRIKGLL